MHVGLSGVIVYRWAAFILPLFYVEAVTKYIYFFIISMFPSKTQQSWNNNKRKISLEISASLLHNRWPLALNPTHSCLIHLQMQPIADVDTALLKSTHVWVQPMWAGPGLKFNFLDYAIGTQHSNNWDAVKTDNRFSLKAMKSYFFNSFFWVTLLKWQIQISRA